MTNEKIAEIIEEAARLLRENPDWTYNKAITEAKKLMTNVQ